MLSVFGRTPGAANRRPTNSRARTTASIEAAIVGEWFLRRLVFGRLETPVRAQRR
jgi:hypothetical protein